MNNLNPNQNNQTTQNNTYNPQVPPVNQNPAGAPYNAYGQPMNYPQMQKAPGFFQTLYGNSNTTLGKVLMISSVICFIIMAICVFIAFVSVFRSIFAFRSILSSFISAFSYIRSGATFLFFGAVLAALKNRTDK